VNAVESREAKPAMLAAQHRQRAPMAEMWRLGAFAWISVLVMVGSQLTAPWGAPIEPP
jgi:hypothetical protein